MLFFLLLIALIKASSDVKSCSEKTSSFHPYEMKIYNYLKENNINFCTQATFEGLKKNTGYMKLDFYLKDKHVAIEIDESQHFPSGNSSSNNDQIRRDSKLNNYFNDNKEFCLIRIHWQDIYTKIPTDFLKAFEECDLSGKIRYSSNKYYLFIDTIWTWTKDPDYEYIIGTSNSSVTFGVLSAILLLSNAAMCAMYYKHNSERICSDRSLISSKKSNVELPTDIDDELEYDELEYDELNHLS